MHATRHSWISHLYVSFISVYTLVWLRFASMNVYVPLSKWLWKNPEDNEAAKNAWKILSIGCIVLVCYMTITIFRSKISHERGSLSIQKYKSNLHGIIDRQTPLMVAITCSYRFNAKFIQFNNVDNIFSWFFFFWFCHPFRWNWRKNVAKLLWIQSANGIQCAQQQYTAAISGFCHCILIVILQNEATRNNLVNVKQI